MNNVFFFLCVCVWVGEFLTEPVKYKVLKYHIVQQFCPQMQIQWAVTGMAPGYLLTVWNHLLGMKQRKNNKWH